MKSFTSESVDQTYLAGSKSPAESENLYEFFGDWMSLLLFQDEITAMEYKLISIVHSLITTKVLIKLGQKNMAGPCKLEVFNL